MMYLPALSLLTALLPLASGRPSSLLRRDLLPPSQDPFYQPPTGYEATTPGTILKTRHAPSPFANSTGSIQLLYRTTTYIDAPLTALTTVFIPSTPDPKKLLSVQEPYDSPNVDCSPSFSVQQPAGDFSNDTAIQLALNEGWFVNLPDYEGTIAAFGNGVQAGRGVLDSIRAVLASEKDTGVDCDAIVTMQGYSGGALASEWATEVQPRYAPELAKSIVGAALGGLVPTLAGVINDVNRADYAMLIPNALVGLTAENPDLRKVLLDELNASGPRNASGFLRVLHECLADTLPAFAGTDVFDYFADHGAWLNSSAWLEYVDEVSTMGRRDTPVVPLYSYHGVKDEITPVGETDALMEKYCANGARIEYVRNATANHLTEYPDGLANAFAWLVERMEGVPVAEGCNITTID